MKIVVVDDEALLVRAFALICKTKGMRCSPAPMGWKRWNLPGPRGRTHDSGRDDAEMDGLTACTKIREFSQVPIIMLTAKTEDMDKLMGFDHGADDYLTKPFNILELKARIRALLRRAGNQGQEAQKRNYLTGGNIKLDLDARNAYKNGELANLTAKEFDVIEFLMHNPNRVYSREALLDTIWAYEYRATSVRWTFTFAACGKSWRTGRHSPSIF